MNNMLSRIKHKLISMFERVAFKFYPLVASAYSTPLRLIVTFASSVLISFYTVYIFIVYMMNNKIFSFDMLKETFSMSVFFYTNLIMFVLFAFMFFGSIPVFFHYVKSKKNKLIVQFCLYLFLNVVLLIVFISIVKSNYGLFIFLISFLFIIVMYFTASWFFSIKAYLITVVVGTLFLLFVPLLDQKYAQELIRYGLKNFGTGGEILVSVSNIEKNNELIGTYKLILLSPDNIYLKSDQNKTLIIPRSQNIAIEYLSQPNPTKKAPK